MRARVDWILRVQDPVYAAVRQERGPRERFKELAWIACCAGDITVHRAHIARVRGQTPIRCSRVFARLRERAALNTYIRLTVSKNDGDDQCPPLCHNDTHHPA